MYNIDWASLFLFELPMGIILLAIATNEYMKWKFDRKKENIEREQVKR